MANDAFTETVKHTQQLILAGESRAKVYRSLKRRGPEAMGIVLKGAVCAQCRRTCTLHPKPEPNPRREFWDCCETCRATECWQRKHNPNWLDEEIERLAAFDPLAELKRKYSGLPNTDDTYPIRRLD